MIDVYSPFHLQGDTVIRFLLEDNLHPEFSFRKKTYYKLLRPLVPLWLRKQVQKRYGSSVSLKEDFIDDTMVKIVLSSEENEHLLRGLYPSPYTSCVVLTHDVDTHEGFQNIPRIFETEQRLGLRSSWNIVPYKYKIDRGVIDLLRSNGHEIGIHGYNHDGLLYFSRKMFEERVPLINRAIREYEAVGFRSPMVHRDLEWLQDLDIEYDTSCFDYDPYQPFPGGTGSIWPFVAGKFVELPYTMPQDHTLFYVLRQKGIGIWTRKAKWLQENNGVILTLTHPDYLNTRSHLKCYEDLLKFLKEAPGTWYCLPRELAGWWQHMHKFGPTIGI